jgi:hypothetical protein
MMQNLKLMEAQESLFLHSENYPAKQLLYDGLSKYFPLKFDSLRKIV